ncbi:unnamed protein product, partial [Ectocarpus sp. 4 AP-2014]
KGWTQKGSRRAILPDSCCDLLGKYYMCHRCMETNKSNKSKLKSSKERVLVTFHGWEADFARLRQLCIGMEQGRVAHGGGQ